MTNESSANAIIGNTLRIIASGEYHPGAELTQKMASYIIELEQKLTDMAVQLANAESKCRELAAGHWPRLQEQDINALMRFNETCEDGEGYDIGAEAMARLVEIGLAGKGPHGIRNITPFGQWVINAREGEVDLEPLKTEEDNIAESALRMDQLRKGAAL